MEANYNYYKIDIADIWQYEQSQVLSGKIASKLATKIIDKTETIIIKEGSPSFGINYRDSQDENERIYYERNLKEYVEASKNLDNRFETNFFFNKYSCFEYDQDIIIKRDNIDFDFWFTLKLRQYDSKISEVKKFLNSQLIENFSNDINELIDFLKFVIRQDQDKFLIKIVIDTINDWIGAKSKLKNSNELQDFEKSHREENEKPQDALILNINYDQEILFEILEPYFDENDHGKLNILLKKENIEDKICFKSNANQFVTVFRQLHLNQKIIGSLVNTEIWICKYFTYLKQNQITCFDKQNVHKILTRTSYSVLKSRRIVIPGLEYIIDKSK